ncbi:MAG: OPT/YSL family transporter [Candidatus Jordarchaeum sp.]|uniref:OPT/YSL family transporter n=1 Tax=Candidatus Jordarchaeum sp. TaxID=2823881 RepID=UPI00404AE437
MPKKQEKEPETVVGPEIPKRSPFTKRAIIFGLIVGTLYIFLAVYISLKTGVVFIAGTVLLGYIFLSIWGKYSPQENVVVTSIAEGSMLVGISVIASLPAIVIYSRIISERTLDPIFYFLNPIFTITVGGNPVNYAGEIWYNSLITPELLIVLGLFAGVTGLFLLLPFKEQLLKRPWPGVIPVYRTIEGLGAIEEAKNRLLKGMGIAAAYTGTFIGLGVFTRLNLLQFPAIPLLPSWLASLKTLWLGTLPPQYQTLFAYFTQGPLPEFLGISNSPLIGAMGYFVGWKRALLIFSGALWSIFVWIIWEFGNPLVTYGEHFMLPMIYYAAMGFLISYIVWEFIKIGLKYREDQKKMKELQEQLIKAATEGKIDAEQAAPYLAIQKMGPFEKMKQSVKLGIANLREQGIFTPRKILPMIIVLTIFIGGTILIFNTNNPFSQNALGLKVLDFPWYLTLASTPLLAFSGWWFATALGEAGFVVNYLTDTIVVPAIIIFSINFPSIVIFSTIVNTMQQSAGRYIGRIKVGRFLNVKDKIVRNAMLVGIIFGAFASAFIIMQLYSYGGFGTVTFPAPAAAITGLFFMSMVELRELWLGGGTGGIGGAGVVGVVSDPITYWVRLLLPDSLKPFSLQIADLIKPFHLQSWFVGSEQVMGAISISGAIFFIGGLTIGIILAKADWSPISLAVGLLIPPYIGVTMILGGLLNYYVYRRNKADQAKYAQEETKYQHLLGGAATGDGVTQILWILATMFMP